MTHQLFQLPKPTGISSNLTLLAGAKVEFFLTTTTTPTPVYQDSGLTTPHTNPVVADAAGRFPPIYLNPSIVYKATFYDSADVEIYTADPVNDQLLSQAIIAGYLYPRTLAEIAAGVTPVNYAYPPGNVLRYGTNTTPGTTDMSTAIQAAINVALRATGGPVGEVYLPEGICLIASGIECNDQTGSGNYRPSVRIVGAGKKRTRILNHTGGAAFRHTLTQSQGDDSSFARGLEFSQFEVYDDGSSANTVGFSLQGAYNPSFQDIIVNDMGSHGITTPSDVRWANSDNYSCADVTLNRVTIIACGGWAVKNEAFATAYVINTPYFVSNVGGGCYLEGSLNRIIKGSISGNGAAVDSASCGVHFVRSAGQTPNGCVIEQTELDGNFNRQVRINGTNCRVDRAQLADDATSGSFASPVQIEVIALTGQSADSNVIEYCRMRFTAQGAANVTAVQFNLDSLDGRTVRYNVSNRNTIAISGATSGVVTEVSFGSNPTASESIGNKSYTNTSPHGSTFIGTTTRDISTASGTQVITGIGFRPTGLIITGFIPNTQSFTEGYVDSTLGNRGMYYYPTGSVYADTGSGIALVFRTAAGDTYEGVVTAFSDDGFTITWTKTGTPTGTATIKFMATR